ncbi:hypothetical protein ACI2IX_19795 [Leifsonia aquatica]|uniref:hypothetical protein n=1 Tax=Leifsonia aquatica TaxID=144185 RepID=UPI0038503C48
MSDTYHGWVRLESLPEPAVWELSRVATGLMRDHFKKLVRGPWIIQLYGTTQNDRTYWRKTFSQLRDAMGASGAAPRSISVSLRPTLGRSRVYALSWLSYWGQYPSAELWVFGHDRITVEDTLRSLVDEIRSHAELKTVLGDATFIVSDIKISSTDSKGGGEVHTGLWRWLTGVASAVVAGVVVAVILALLRIN